MMHGKQGKGRYRALSLGNAVYWESVTKQADGNSKVKLTLTTSEPDRPTLEEGPAREDEERGTHVEVLDVTPAATRLLSNGIVANLTAQFATYLLGTPSVELTINGFKIDPRRALESDVTTSVEHKTLRAELRVIFWKDKSAGQEILLCSEAGVALKQFKGPKVGDYAYAAYARSEAFNEDWSENEGALGELSEASNAFITFIVRKVHEVLRERFAKDSAEIVKGLRVEGVYPYSGEPKDESEKATREVFDAAVRTLHEVSPDLAGANKDVKAVKMRALAAAVETSPDARHRIVQQVFGLSDTDIHRFDEVLSRIGMAKVVSLTAQVVNRIDFLHGLRLLTTDRLTHRRLLERKQLHKFIEREMWIFGEQYHLSGSDVGMRTVLKSHIGLLGREELQPIPRGTEGMDDVVDLMLSSRLPTAPEHFEHLVVELKRPSVKIGSEEYGQIQRYARTVANNDAFDKTRTIWNFVAVSTSLDPEIEDMVRQRDRSANLVQDSGHYRLWVYTWGQLIQSAESRMRYLRESLSLETSEEDAYSYLRSTARPGELPSHLLDEPSSTNPLIQ